MRPSTSLYSILTLALVLSSNARAEEILPPFGHEVLPAQNAASILVAEANELVKQSNLFIRKNHLGNPQNPATIHTYYRQAFYDVRGMQSAASSAQSAIGGGDAVASYENLKNTFLSLNNSIRSMKNSGLKNTLQVGQAFDGVRNSFENVRGYFISRWNNKAWVEASAVRAIEAIRYSVDRLKELLDNPFPGPITPGPIGGVVTAVSPERTRVAIAQMRVIRDDVQNFQSQMAYAARDPRSAGLQSALNETRQSVQILQQLVSRPGVMVDAQTETNAVNAAVRQLDDAYTAELN